MWKKSMHSIRPVKRRAIIPHASLVQRVVLVAAALGALFLGAGCEFVYLPECDTQCTAGGGDDTYGRAMQ